MGTLSALSLRVFSEDVTVAGRQASTKKTEAFKQEEDMTDMTDMAGRTPVPEGPVHVDEIEGVESTPD